MARIVSAVVAVLVVALMSVSAANAGPAAGPACCACQVPDRQSALFCERVSPDGQDALGDRCRALGGVLLCEIDIGGGTCTFENLACPLAPAPALGGIPLAGLALMLGTVGMLVLRRRPRRAVAAVRSARG
jgi:hypothetical protein